MKTMQYLSGITGVAMAMALVFTVVTMFEEPTGCCRGMGKAIAAESQKPEETQANITENVIKITAKRFDYTPSEIKLKKGVAVIFEFTSLDRHHGFNCPDLGVRADILPGQVTRLRIVPQNAGTFEFHCDVFCGDGHEDMSGKIIVEE